MDNNIRDLVSVIIPTCDRGELFYKAIDSVVKQTYDNVEIIVVDDCSSKLIDLKRIDINNRNIVIVRNDQKCGGAISRNIGVSHSSGEYVAFLDDDDFYYPKKISLLINEIKKDSSLDAVFGRLDKRSEPDRVIDTSLNDKSGHIISNDFVKYMHTNTSLYKKDSFNLIKFDEKLAKFQDTQLHIESIKKLKCKYVDISVAFWNDNHGGDQITSMKSREAYLKHLDNYSRLILNLRKRNSISLSYAIYMKVKYYYKLLSYIKEFYLLNILR